MTLSIKEIKSKFDKRFIQIAPTGWVETNEYIIGKLLKDHYTKKIYFRTSIKPSSPSHKQVMEYQMKFLSRFTYTHQLSYFNRLFNNIISVTELRGFRKDM